MTPSTPASKPGRLERDTIHRNRFFNARARLMREATPKSTALVTVMPLLIGLAFACSSIFPRILIWRVDNTIGLVLVSIN